ncbi:putative Ig domain-containing protein [Undibacterium sp. SXout7W]|uniref:putative Ig domain-containing protein n=1 Tax=Undibacterium sp. SXout7W TaxID=3413049 RepID=UPI003BF4480B
MSRTTSLNKLSLPAKNYGWMTGVCAALVLSACGGEQTAEQALPALKPQAEIATGTTTFQIDVPVLPADVAAQMVQPSFHLAPALLAAPDNADASNNTATARMQPHHQELSAELRNVSSRRLNLAAIEALQVSENVVRHRRMQAVAPQDTVTPMATGAVVATYSPAQIRAAYGLPALPASFTGLTSTQAAQLGAGQTIYIVNANHDPSLVAELTAFNQKFGLPACTLKAIATSTTLPLPAASATTCELSVVYGTASGTMIATTPAYDAGWASEIALDVQWAHATAPLARIVLIEAPDASMNNMLGAIKLANTMGPGIVSMSFGSLEGNWTASVDSTFTSAKMTYLAATGDTGASVQWPAVSPNVVAVGGTSLTYSGSGARTEVSWSGTGGGISSYTPVPSYQTASVPGMGTLARRAVADVAFNADPSTGQYVAMISPGSATVNWVSAGGTSLATPQWAGIIAIANASRALSSKAALGTPHAVLYGQISTVPGTYAAAFADITKGSDGTCTTCTAKVGYDPLSGLGTPNVSSLLSTLTGASTAPVVTAPVVTAAAISGKVGTALSFTVSATSANALTYSLTGAPAGMSISTAGVVSWATPVAGTYAVTVLAKDSVTGLTGQAVYTVTITAATAPVITATTVNGTVGTALSFTVSATSSNPLTYSLTGAPAGMAISTTGVVTWATPLAGSYPVTVVVKDSKTGLSSQAVYTVVIAAATAPKVSTASISGQVGVALSFTVTATSANPVTYSLTGAPTGMAVSTAGVVSWASPVAGTYAVTVVAKDSKTGLSGQGVYTVTVVAAGLTVTAPAMTGVAGKAMSGSITISAPGATGISLSISNAPLGMTFSMSGLTINTYWASPVTGTYSMAVSVVDSLGRKANVTVPITVTAK